MENRIEKIALNPGESVNHIALSIINEDGDPRVLETKSFSYVVVPLIGQKLLLEVFIEPSR